ncbi:AraC family transcriptional regulator InvF [Serratia proteamaculans]|uniref:AraC family transcriptional regulator InvF n=1 Tax=Serratia proteamaculans TaxID=28151 RepID=UPI00197EC24E|nr:AraC family transcriptional regulator InvF [Serratia proteamaculans]
MADHIVLKEEEILSESCKRTVQTQEVWFLDISDGHSVHMNLSWRGGNASWEASGCCLLLLDRVDVEVIKGELSFCALRLEVLSQLLGFLDEARELETFDANASPWMPLSLLDKTVLESRKRCEYWFLQEMLNPSSNFKNFFNFLRQRESYWLVRFLLAETSASRTLQELGLQYGVSYSHFRRLCCNALGGGGKAKLRDWRMARSLLDAIEGQENLTQVAIKHGYASSSHFSYEIKELLGVSPRGLINTIRMAKN